MSRSISAVNVVSSICTLEREAMLESHLSRSRSLQGHDWRSGMCRAGMHHQPHVVEALFKCIRTLLGHHLKRDYLERIPSSPSSCQICSASLLQLQLYGIVPCSQGRSCMPHDKGMALHCRSVKERCLSYPALLKRSTTLCTWEYCTCQTRWPPRMLATQSHAGAAHLPGCG